MGTTCSVLLMGLLLFSAAQQPCTDEQIRDPQPPEMVEVDLDLVQGVSGLRPLAEWSKVEKLQNFYRAYTVDQAPCSIVEGDEIAARLFIARTSVDQRAPDQAWGQFTAEKAFQFYGISRLKVERADKDVTREFAFPLKGTATIEDISPAGQMETVVEDLAQLQLLTVPRLQLRRTTDSGQNGQAEDCFLISRVTLVPSRVFDEPLKSGSDGTSEINLTLNARRLALESVAHEVRWLDRLDKEEPACRAEEGAGYLGRQIRSLNLTVRELIPELDYIAQSLRFWKEVEHRIELIRAEDEGWMQELKQEE